MTACRRNSRSERGFRLPWRRRPKRRAGMSGPISSGRTRAQGALGCAPPRPSSRGACLPDLCTAYAWPSGLAGRGVIGIVELDGGWVQADIDAFFKSVNQPSPSIKDVVVSGPGNAPNQHLNDPDDPDYEVTMDIQIAAAAYFSATGQPASIRVYWADGT